ncbi:MAG: hypothetical protein R3D03_12890 [Geminicoccaceae bacterium]
MELLRIGQARLVEQAADLAESADNILLDSFQDTAKLFVLGFASRSNT